MLEAALQKGNGRPPDQAASENKANREIVLEAVEQKKEQEAVLEVMLGAAKLLKGADRVLMLKAVKQNASSSQHAASEHKADREIVLEAVKRNGCALTMRHRSTGMTGRSCS